MKATHPIYDIILNSDPRLGFAESLEELPLFLLPEEGFVENWRPLVFELRDRKFGDYVSCEYSLRLCSQRLREILQQNASPHDVLQWLDIQIRRGSEERQYFVLHFPEPRDVLDKEHTVYGTKEGSVIKPAFSRRLCEQYNIFTHSKDPRHGFYIRDHVKKAIEAAKCTGMEFWGRPEY
jgi:hypothetical protein